jgi:RNA polymerase sigma factor (TIGR02999 family)
VCFRCFGGTGWCVLPQSTHQVSQLLADWQQGDQAALDSLVPLVYAELRKIARRHLWRQGNNLSLESRVLVHELYLKLPQLKDVHWEGRAHFLCVMSHLMRQVLTDRARSRHYAKRDGVTVSLDEGIASSKKPDVNLVVLDDALKTLEKLDAQQSRLVELRFFGGLSIEETAEALGISPATVKREWATAKAWLSRELAPSR